MKKPRLFRILQIGTILCAVLAMGILTARKVLEWLIFEQISQPVSNETIGVIGGADGPTAIFIASNSCLDSPYLWAMVFAGLALVGFVALLILKKRRH